MRELQLIDLASERAKDAARRQQIVLATCNALAGKTAARSNIRKGMIAILRQDITQKESMAISVWVNLNGTAQPADQKKQPEVPYYWLGLTIQKGIFLENQPGKVIYGFCDGKYVYIGILKDADIRTIDAVTFLTTMVALVDKATRGA